MPTDPAENRRSAPSPSLRRLVPLALLLLLGACGYSGPHYAGNRWDGRRGYNGSGDYGYDVNASRAEARSYRTRASRNYPTPGPASDPWGPYIREAADKHRIPERWIREVMRQESGGRLQASDGSLTTSNVGAMGLMQVMPATYDMLRRRYGLGDDPYEPRNNIQAGAAYIREMFDQFGAPAFLAAYNAGPDRLNSYLAGTNILPDETVNYLARVAPRLGTEVAMTGPLATYAGRGTAYAAHSPPGRYAAAAPVAAPQMDEADRAYAGGGMAGAAYFSPGRAGAAGTGAREGAAALLAAAPADDPADRAYEGGGLVTAEAPTGRNGYVAPAPATPPAPTYAPRQAVAAAMLPAPMVAPASYPMPASYRAPTSPLAAPQAAPLYAPASYAPVAPPRIIPASSRAYAAPYASQDRSPAPSFLALPSAQAAPRIMPSAMAATAPVAAGGGWGIQVGAYPDPAISRAALQVAQARTGHLLASAQPAITPVQRGGTLYRARLTGVSAGAASAACDALQRGGMSCFTVPPGA